MQEALTNVIRHASAANVAVRVRYGATSLGIDVEDDGSGSGAWAAVSRAGARASPADGGPEGGAGTAGGAWTAGGTRTAGGSGNAGAKPHLGDGVAHRGDAGPSDRAGGGNGIAGMRERARLLGGELSARPLPGSGFLVRARLPLNRDGDREPAAHRPTGRRAAHGTGDHTADRATSPTGAADVTGSASAGGAGSGFAGGAT